MLGSHPKTASLVSDVAKLTERDRDAQRKRDKRSESARIYIPECKNPKRREQCLDDPERFMRTYFGRDYSRPFGKLHNAMISSMVEIATNGGTQSIAAPRGRGKTQIVKGVIPWIVLRGLRRFPVLVSQTTKQAYRLYNDFRKKLAFNDLLYEDFPEVCHPIRALEGAPQRAARQHIDGELTHIVWKTDELRLADVPAKYRGPIQYGGVRLEYRGLDAAIRGINADGDRPDFVCTDEPETRDSAKSIGQIEDRINAIDKDIAGLAGEDVELAHILLTTIQNDYCLSYQFTDPDQRPSWMPKRFAWVEKWPEEYPLEGVLTGKWHEYIALRKANQKDGDRYGRGATQFYLDNREAMERGGELLSDNYKTQTLQDGWVTVHSAWQEVFNAISDTSFDAFCTEFQNNPPKAEKVESIGLTAAKVQSRVSKNKQGEVPSTTEARVVGIDIGDRTSHWCDTAWEGAAIGSVVDYGVMETWFAHGSDAQAIELALLASLHTWADELMNRVNPVLCLVDSGSGVAHKPAVYRFCKERGAPFFPSKGWDEQRFKPKQRQQGIEPFEQCWAHWQPEDGVWLYNVNTEYWKMWTHRRWMTDPFDAAGYRTDGSLVLFDDEGDRKRHLAFSHHITAEEEQFVPVFEKGMKRVWKVKNRNNHWLDALALACCGASCVGIKLVADAVPQPVAAQPREPKRFLDPYGRPFLATRR